MHDLNGAGPNAPDLGCHPIQFRGSSPLDEIRDYLKRMAALCPFIEPSEKAGCLYVSQITLDCSKSEDIHPRMFEQIVPAIERYREQRRNLADKNRRLLLSHTIVFRIPAHLDAEANRLMAWPNWLSYLVKDLYTPKAIVFGFIRKGVSERSAGGEAIPVAPFHALVIRSKVIGADHRFFAGNEALLSALAEAVDDDGNAHAGVLPEIPDLRDPAAIRASQYFARLRDRAQMRLKERNS